jgi:hypothetical protein
MPRLSSTTGLTGRPASSSTAATRGTTTDVRRVTIALRGRAR